MLRFFNSFVFGIARERSGPGVEVGGESGQKLLEVVACTFAIQNRTGHHGAAQELHIRLAREFGIWLGSQSCSERVSERMSFEKTKYHPYPPLIATAICMWTLDDIGQLHPGSKNVIEHNRQADDVLRLSCPILFHCCVEVVELSRGSCWSPIHYRQKRWRT